MLISIGLIAIIGLAWWLRQPRLVFRNQQQMLRTLERIARIKADQKRRSLFDQYWDVIHKNTTLPCCEGEKALLVYRAPHDVSAVEIMGDHNRWQPQEADQFRRLGLSRVWTLEMELPEAARIDYKLRVNQRHIFLDPENPYKQMSGFGPNSELRMPRFEPNEAALARPDVQSGYLETDRQIHSKQLGYRVNYSIYHPMKARGSHLPVLYVTDGHEFIGDHMGGFANVMNNLIEDGLISPCYVVFLDPRNTDKNLNRRMDEYGHQYAKFASMLVEELIPNIEMRQPDRTSLLRGIVGTSLGGQFAAYVCAKHGDTFGLGGILSPAFWFNDRHHNGEILKLYEQAPEHALRLFVGIGTLEGLLPDARRFHKLLTKHQVEHAYYETPQGHSWGSWRSMVGRMVTYLLPPED